MSLKRQTYGTEPFYCSPETGCRNKNCGGQPIGSPRNHGIGMDEWYFTVSCEHGWATTLLVSGTQLHPGIPEDHPARQARNTGCELMNRPNPLVLSVCRPQESKSERLHECEYFEGHPPKVSDNYYGNAAGFWANAGVGLPAVQQPESFWDALESVHRDYCLSCDSDETNTRRVIELLRRPE